MPHKIALVVYSSLDGDGKSANFRALNTAEELLTAGDDVALVYDGSGTKALGAMLDRDHDFHKWFVRAEPALRHASGGACKLCAKAYKTLDAIEEAGVELLDGFKGHASLRELLNEGRQIITF